MTKDEIHQLALLAAAKMTLVASAACSSASPPGPPQPLAITIPPEAPPGPRPLPAASNPPTAHSAGGPSSSDCAAVVRSLRQGHRELSPAEESCCAQLIPQSGEGTREIPGVSYLDLVGCCSSETIFTAHRRLCAPWGPPAPPSMPRGWS